MELTCVPESGTGKEGGSMHRPEMKKLEIGALHPVLEEDIDNLIQAINTGKEFYDCELCELEGDINQCESCRVISSPVAQSLRDYYLSGGWVNGSIS